MRSAIILLLLIAGLTLTGTGTGFAAKSKVAYVDSRDRHSKTTPFGERLDSLGYRPENVTAKIEEGDFKFKNVDILVFTSFSLSSGKIREFLTREVDDVRDFVRKGGCMVMFTQNPDDWNRETWLLPGMSLLRSDHSSATLNYVNREHPLFSHPNALASRRLTALWNGEGLSQYSFRAVSRGWVLAAQDERGQDPWCVEFGWGRGRALFLACAADRTANHDSESRVKAASSLIENAMAYASAVARGRPSALPDHAIVVETKTGIKPRAAYYTKQARLAFETEVNAAVDRGVAFLKSRQLGDGSWGRQNQYAAGTTALVLVALLGAGTSKHEACIGKGIDFLLEQQPLQYTYDLGLTMMALDAWAAPMYERFELEKLDSVKRKTFEFKRDLTPRVRLFMEQCRDQLVSNQADNGYWSYGPDPGRMTDLSNTQIAILGLRAALRCGVEVPGEVWIDSIQRLLESQVTSGPKVGLPDLKHFDESAGKLKFYVFQAKERPWSYRPKGDFPGPPGAGGNRPGGRGGRPPAAPDGPEDYVSGSRTAMGVSSLLIALEGLALESKSRAKRYSGQVQKASRDSLGWLWSNWSVEENPGAGNVHYFYYLYALERVGIVSSRKFIGDRDWYHEGAVSLLGKQYESGAWGDGVIDTCFALMFLKRTTPPPVITMSK